MTNNQVIAVFDIGKTNKKILLFNQEFKVVYQHEKKMDTTSDEDGFECDDINLIQDWMVEALNAIVEEGKFDIKGVNFSTYGASLAFLDKDGKRLTPIYNYLKEVDSQIQDSLFDAYGGVNEFCRKTASPALGLLLNSGIQMLWLKQNKPNIWSQVQHVLHFPQYISYALTGKIASEPTSIGCHTYMWDFDKMQYHNWIADKGISLPKPINNNTVYPSVFKDQVIEVGVGIHDSSASLVPYLDMAKEDFILVSTGTWCISMNPFNSETLTANQLKKDCLCYLTPQNQQVKSSRLFMGHFHEVLVDKLNEFFGVDDHYYKTISYQPALLDAVKTKIGEQSIFFPNGAEGFNKEDLQIDLTIFENYDQAYSWMVKELTDLSITSIHLIIAAKDTTKTIFVSGGFARNPIFVHLLSQHFNNKQVLTSEIDNASALGAALAIAPNFKGFDTTQVELVTASKA